MEGPLRWPRRSRLLPPQRQLRVFSLAFTVKGWIFYSALNSVVPQIILHLGFEDNSWRISVRQLSYQLLVLVTSIPITWYATNNKDPKTPLLAQLGKDVQGVTPEILAAAVEASRAGYARPYRFAWASVIPLVVLAIVAVAFMKGVNDLMTEKVEATVERVLESKRVNT